MNITKLVLIRHGESKWNLENKFTGWIDIDLSHNGILESNKSGIVLKNNNIIFDIAFSSFLKRSINTLHNILNKMNQLWIPVYKSWRLNERHYGLLQGLNKNETIKKYGKYQVNMWRRSLKEIPPKIELLNNEYYNNRELKYKNLLQNEFPNGESLEMTIKRVNVFWKNIIIPEIYKNNNILLVAHGNSIRSIMQIIHNFDEEKLMSLEIPTGIPYIYEFNNSLNLIKNYKL